MATKILLTADAYTVGLIYVKPLEMHAITTMLDEHHEPVPMLFGDDNEYTLGKIGNHNVAIAGPPRGAQGKAAIANIVSRIRLAFKNIRVGLLVGIGGGAPHLPEGDVRLGDVVVGAPEYGPAVVQYDLGKQLPDGIEVTRMLNKPPELLLKVVDKVEDRYQRALEGTEDFFVTHLQRFAQFPRIRDRYKRPSIPDRLFRADYDHPKGTLCSSHGQHYEVKRPDRDPPDEVRIHYSTILSGDLVMKSASMRDQISAKHHNAVCFEMEAAGLMDVFPCLVVQGICNYSDSHKGNEWEGYAAAVAAAYAREILLTMAERVVYEPEDSKIGLGRAIGIAEQPESLLGPRKSMATSSNRVHARLQRQYRAQASQKYWRFDEDVAISDIAVDDWKQVQRVAGHTHNYLNTDATVMAVDD